MTGHDYEPMSEEWMAKKAETHKRYKHGVIRILPDGWLYPGTTPRFLNRIQSFKVNICHTSLLDIEPPKIGQLITESECVQVCIHSGLR